MGHVSGCNHQLPGMAMPGMATAMAPDGTVSYALSPETHHQLLSAVPMGMSHAAVLGAMGGRPHGAMGAMGSGHAPRGASAKNCIHPGCQKGAIGKLRLCIAHGGALCSRHSPTTFHGLPRPSTASHALSAQAEGANANGWAATCVCTGGKRCSYQGCNKAAQGQKPLCKAHGGGRVSRPPPLHRSLSRARATPL